jgi:hypothetical protein
VRGSFLLELNNAEAREFVHAQLFGKDKPAMNNAAYALLAYADNDRTKTWALDEMIAAIRDRDRPPDRVRDRELMLAETRVAIVRLSHENPAEALLGMGEDPKENFRVRQDAMMALRDYDSSALQERIIALYRRENDPSTKEFCIRLLKDTNSDAVTAALIEHALKISQMHSKVEYATASTLLQTLNKRLGTDFDSIKELQIYLRQNPATRPAR